MKVSITLMTSHFRNDMDTVGVRAGCVFIGFSDGGFSGDNVTVRGEQWDRWVVFARSEQREDSEL